MVLITMEYSSPSLSQAKNVHLLPESDAFSQGQTYFNHPHKIDEQNQNADILLCNEKSVKETFY